MAEIVHIAGPLITFGNVQRQRCAWCGGLIDERDLEMTSVAINDGESAEHAAEGLRRSHWDGLVAVDGSAKWSVPEPEDGRAPERSCMQLLPVGGSDA